MHKETPLALLLAPSPRVIAVLLMTALSVGLGPPLRVAAAPGSTAPAGGAAGPSFEVLPMAPTQTPGDKNATFGIGPASSKAPDGRAYLNYLVTPAANSVDYVAVLNIGLTPLNLGVYATDAVPQGPAGTADLPPRATKPVDAGTWIKLPAAATTVTVAPRTTVIVPFAVMIPASASPGDHGAAIVASLATTARNPQGELVHVDQRVATRAFIRVGGDLRPKLDIEDLRAIYHQNLLPWGAGSVTVRYVVHNSGNLKLGAGQRVSVSALFGQKKVRTLATLPLLLPGARADMSVRFSGILPELLGTARVKVTPLAALGDADPPLTVAGASTHVLMLPLILLLIILLIIGVRFARRELRRRWGSRSSGPGPSGEDASVGQEALS